MAVSNYEQECKYVLSRLKDVVHLFPSRTDFNYEIDRGAAYVNTNISPISLHGRNVTLSETEEFDERYEFTHNVTFTLDGYNTLDEINDMYYIAVEDKDGTLWLLNPYFPAKVTYEYTLAENRNETRYTFATVSNFPVLQLYGANVFNLFPKCEYRYDAIKEIYLNEKIYSRFSNDGRIYYSNDGFKKVDFNKYSASFTETYNGDTVQHRVSFDIPFDYYKSSWHYNLLEFTENKYASIIRTVKGENILCGFGYGLQPSYEVSCEGNESPNRINITLFDLHSDEGLTTYFDENVNIGGLTETTWQYTTKYDGYECVREGYARYLLQEEVDAFGNPTGNYRCLQGFENRFPGVNIVGTFTSTEEFKTLMCGGKDCTLRTSLPSSYRILFTENNCRRYDIYCDSDWTITTGNLNGFTISPLKGNAGQTTTLEICATNVKEMYTAEFTLSYCDGQSKTWKVDYTPSTGNECFQNGTTYYVGPESGSLNVMTQCCIQSATSSTLTNVTLYTGYIRVSYPVNNTGSQRNNILDVTLCDGRKVTIYIIQTAGYELWVKEGTACNGSNLCDVERKYTGTTASLITGRTEETRFTNCRVSQMCQTIYVEWEKSDETYCDQGKMWSVEVEKQKIGDGEWYYTGSKRLGNEIPDPEGKCDETGVEWEYTWELTDKTICDLSYPEPEPPEPQYKWELNPDGYICEGTTKYQQEDEYISYDEGKTWSKTLEKRKGNVIEINSTDCGYVPPKYYSQYLTLEILTDGEIRLGTKSATGFKYSYDGSLWSEDKGSQTVTINVTAGQKILLKGNMTKATGSSRGIGYIRTNDTASFNVYGNAHSLLYGDDFVDNDELNDSNNYYTFNELFAGCDVVDASNLILPAKTLKTATYAGMFSGCTSLQEAPELPATTLGQGCYNVMFSNCTSLTKAPSILPATTLTDSCYMAMFSSCKSLTKAPELPATELVSNCYNSMFAFCSNLSEVATMQLNEPNKPSGVQIAWLSRVAPTGTIYLNRNITWDPEKYRGNSGIPEGWDIQYI